MTHLCVPIFVTELGKARRDIAAATAVGADLVELRIDTLDDDEVVAILIRDRILPVIVTCRPQWEGGHSKLEDPERAARLEFAAAAAANNVDLELKTAQNRPDLLRRIVQALSANHGELILSSHDFSARPANLQQIVAQLNAIPAQVNKIVWLAKDIRENLDALKVLTQASRPTIALCMGEVGLISRVLAKKFGAFLTFAALDLESATAPGQITASELKNLYRWDAIGRKTIVYGVVGHPIGHSMSPAIHNAAFTAVGHDGVYLPLLVEPGYETFKSFMDDFLAFAELDLRGLSVTIPHKENALRYLRENGGEIEELAQSIGAVNTIAIRRDAAAKLSGTNTDYAAILDSITAELGIGRDQLAGLRVAILGAGGTARASVAGLAHYGATVLLCNRTPERAAALVEEFNGRRGTVQVTSFDELTKNPCDVFINTTSVGMYPKIDESPFGRIPPWFSEKTIVFDTIYNPMQTLLLTQAQAMGARTISGVEMFVRQAAGQFETWTGKPAPKGVMRDVISARLGMPLHSRPVPPP